MTITPEQSATASRTAETLRVALAAHDESSNPATRAKAHADILASLTNGERALCLSLGYRLLSETQSAAEAAITPFASEEQRTPAILGFAAIRDLRQQLTNLQRATETPDHARNVAAAMEGIFRRIIDCAQVQAAPL